MGHAIAHGDAPAIIGIDTRCRTLKKVLAAILPSPRISTSRLILRPFPNCANEIS